MTFSNKPLLLTFAMAMVTISLAFSPSNPTIKGPTRLYNAVINNQNALDVLNGFSCCEASKRKFKGKSVLLTGASGGLGKSLASQLVCCGVATLILSGRDEKSLREVAKTCQHISVETAGQMDSIKIHIVICDLADPESVQQLGEESLKICGHVDVLINNGGVSSRSKFLETKLEVDELLMRINFFSGASLAKAVVPGMVSNGFGTIVWISSVQGLSESSSPEFFYFHIFTQPHVLEILYLTILDHYLLTRFILCAVGTPFRTR